MITILAFLAYTITGYMNRFLDNLNELGCLNTWQLLIVVLQNKPNCVLKGFHWVEKFELIDFFRNVFWRHAIKELYCVIKLWFWDRLQVSSIFYLQLVTDVLKLFFLHILRLEMLYVEILGATFCCCFGSINDFLSTKFDRICIKKRESLCWKSS